MPSRKRKTSPRYATSTGCAPLLEMYQRAERDKAKRWADVEPDFLGAMWQFDENLRQRIANQGDNQNGKGDFVTDLIALLLENATGKTLARRGLVKGLVFRDHSLDAFYPASGEVELTIETKAAGAPKTSKNPSQKNPLGRAASQDLKKRITEVGLKTIDLKAEAARREGEGRGPAGDLVHWLRTTRPWCYLFLAVRVVSRGDLQATIQLVHSAGQMFDAVGLMAFQPAAKGSGYEPLVVPTDIELARVLESRVASRLPSAIG